MPRRYDRDILVLGDDELELFVREWIDRKKGQYFEIKRFSGAGDLGRDIVGFVTQQRHEGHWDNYQCKQYRTALPTDVGVREIGKILHFAHLKHFTAPRRYVFVAPRGVNRNLERLIDNPTQFKATVIGEWNKYCADAIAEGQHIALDQAFSDFIDSYDFSAISRTTLDDMLNDADVMPVLHKWFGADPGPPPAGSVPAQVQPLELQYVQQLVDAYAEREGVAFPDVPAVFTHPAHGPHLVLQRERFYDADAFRRFYRDNTAPEVLADFERDIYHGIIDIYQHEHSDALTRVDRVMTQAAQVQAAGPLAPHARVPVKQGVCHHFANESRLKWRR